IPPERPRPAFSSSFQDVDRAEVSVELVVVQPIADDELVRNVEALIRDRHRLDPSLRLVEQHAQLQGGWPVTLDMVEEEGRGQAGIDDVLDHQDVSTLDIHG